MNLFCYGTLIHPQIISAVIGRLPRSEPARLNGYQIYSVKSTPYPALINCDTATVDGIVYQGLSPGEMQLLDDYEGDEYQRRQSVLLIGDNRLSAWVYVYKSQYRNRLAGQGWDYTQFVERHLSVYLARFGQ
jgi:gamma-glutamylcyclotransferase (GGCT)/AIG2-like uncharacterized protein YtfP